MGDVTLLGPNLIVINAKFLNLPKKTSQGMRFDLKVFAGEDLSPFTSLHLGDEEFPILEKTRVGDSLSGKWIVEVCGQSTKISFC